MQHCLALADRPLCPCQAAPQNQGVCQPLGCAIRFLPSLGAGLPWVHRVLSQPGREMVSSGSGRQSRRSALSWAGLSWAGLSWAELVSAGQAARSLCAELLSNVIWVQAGSDGARSVLPPDRSAPVSLGFLCVEPSDPRSPRLCWTLCNAFTSRNAKCVTPSDTYAPAGTEPGQRGV